MDSPATAGGPAGSTARVSFHRSTDYPRITRLLTDPKCYRRMVDDEAPAASEFHARPLPGLEYIVCTRGGEDAAVFLLLASGAAAEVHHCFAPAAWGDAERISRAFLAWVWASTPYQRLTGRTPAHNRLALKLALAVGFQLAHGPCPAPIFKRGARHDLIKTEIQRPLTQ